MLLKENQSVRTAGEVKKESTFVEGQQCSRHGLNTLPYIISSKRGTIISILQKRTLGIEH